MRRWTMLLALAALTLGRESLGQELKERARFRLTTSGTDSVALSPDGNKLATCTRGVRTGEVTLWDVASGKEITTFTLKDQHPEDARFSPDGKLLAAVVYCRVIVWDVTARKLLATLKTNIGSSCKLAFSPDGKKLGLTNTVETQLWDLTSGKKLSSFRHPMPAPSIHAVAFQPDLRTLAVGNAQEIDLWDVASGKRRAILSEHRGLVGHVAYSADGKTLVAASHLERGGSNGRLNHVGDVRFWDVSTGRTRAVFQEGIAFGPSDCLSPDGKTLALLNRKGFFPDKDAELRIVDVAAGKQRVVPLSLGGSFTSLTFATDGRLFLIDNPDNKTIKLWEVSFRKRANK